VCLRNIYREHLRNHRAPQQLQATVHLRYFALLCYSLYGPISNTYPTPTPPPPFPKRVKSILAVELESSRRHLFAASNSRQDALQEL